MAQIPDVNQLEFFLLPATFTTLIIGFSLLAFTLLLIKVPKLRPYFAPLFKLYYILALTPLYIGAGIIYGITLGKINVIQKLRNVHFFEKFKHLYLDPKAFFEDMRLNPTNYFLWVGVYICFVQICIDYVLIVTITEIFYEGKDTIIFGILSTEAPVITNPIVRWLYMTVIGVLVWVPTKFAIPAMVSIAHKYDNSDEPKRPWWDKARLLYIGWAYIITADAVWCLGMVLTLLVYLFIPSWEVLIFTWVCIIICGIIELTYQQYSIQGLFKLGWFKSFIIWLLSMIPFMISTVLLVGLLGSAFNAAII